MDRVPVSLRRHHERRPQPYSASSSWIARYHEPLVRKLQHLGVSLGGTDVLWCPRSAAGLRLVACPRGFDEQVMSAHHGPLKFNLPINEF